MDYITNFNSSLYTTVIGDKVSDKSDSDAGIPPFETYIAIDIEHNSRQDDEDKNQILELAAVAVSHGQIINKFFTRVRLHVDFNKDVEEYCHLHEEDYTLDILPDERTALADFRFILAENDLVAHYIDNDVRELNIRLSRYGLDNLKPVCADTKDLYLKHVGGKEFITPCRLPVAAKEMGLPEFTEHNAFEDALTHARLYEKLVHGRVLKE